MRLRAILIGTVFLSSTVISTAGDASLWQKTFGGAQEDLVHAAAVLPDGGYVVCGSTKSKGAGGLDVWVVRFDQAGNIAWEKTFGGPDEDTPVRKAIVVLPDGGFALTGVTLSKGAEQGSLWVVRLDPNGNVVWDKTYGGRGDIGIAIAAMADGGFSVAGQNAANQPFVLRLDRDGSVQWQKMLPGQASQRELVAVAALADGGLLLGGKAKSEASAGFDAWVVRTDPKGEILWDTTYAGPGDEEVDTIVALPEGGFVVAGGDFVVAGGDEEEGAPKSGLAWRLDRDGHVLWQKSFGGPRGAITSSTLLPDSGFVLAGLTATSVGTDRGGSVWRLDPDGNLLWQQTIAGPTPGFISAIDKFPDGRFVVAGVSEVNGQMDGAVAILPPSPAPSGDKPQPAVTAPPADKECAKYVASVGKTISVPCAQAGIPTAAPDQPAAAPVAAPPAPPAPGTAKTAELQPPVPPQTAPQDSVGALDAKLQKLAGWSVVKREFPDWYNEQLREAAKLSAANEPEAAVTKHLVEALVALRRQHANEGIAAGAGKLTSVAAAFLANLQALKARSVANCHEFIATGETSPGVLAVVNVPNEGASIQSYLAAVFEAIADGRKSPATHAKASKADYETLVAQLSKLGWNDRDLKVFSNPSALKEESPAHVCQMVTDWFAAHLAITDPGVQERLLADTLKPGFAG